MTAKRARRPKAFWEMIGVDDTIHLDAKVSDISVGQQQLVEIAKALASDPKILILDEPTASLSGTEIDILFSVIRKLRGSRYFDHLYHALSQGYF